MTFFTLPKLTRFFSGFLVRVTSSLSCDQTPEEDLAALQNSCLSRLQPIPIQINTALMGTVPNVAFNQCLGATLEGVLKGIGNTIMSDSQQKDAVQSAFLSGAAGAGAGGAGG